MRLGCGPRVPGGRRALARAATHITLAPGESLVQDRGPRRGRQPEGRVMRFTGKVALITAAASGIGRATANIIGREGGRIAAVDIDRERLDATVAEIAAVGGAAHAYNA